jgi:hypothetical protein
MYGSSQNRGQAFSSIRQHGMYEPLGSARSRAHRAPAIALPRHNLSQSPLNCSSNTRAPVDGVSITTSIAIVTDSMAGLTLERRLIQLAYHHPQVSGQLSEGQASALLFSSIPRSRPLVKFFPGVARVSWWPLLDRHCVESDRL